MNFADYQTKAWKTAVYPNKGDNMIYPSLGLGGEAGELLNKIKKIYRDEDANISEEKEEELEDEMGDLLWYIAALCTELKLDLNDVAERNISKLSSRQDRNKLHGSGDKR